jgi:hypothetical protein
MLGIRIKNEFLDLYSNTRLQFELNSPMYLGEDIDIIQGSYSFPATVPLGGKNRRLLNYPNLIDNADDLMKDEPCEIYVEGMMLFSGLLSVRSAINNQAKIYMIVSPLSQLKDVNLNELDLGTENMGGDVASILAKAKDTTTSPESYNYIFFPVYNRDFFSGNSDYGDPVDGKGEYQNFWDVDTQAFVIDADNNIFTPFVKVNHILKTGIEDQGFTFTNNFQKSTELQRLVMYNNYSSVADDKPLLDINLADHVNPDTSFSDFVKRLSRNFCLGLFGDFQNETFELTPLKDIINLPPKWNWTSKASEVYKIEANEDVPGLFKYKEAYKAAPDGQKFSESYDQVDWEDETTDIAGYTTPITSKKVYETTTDTVYSYVPTSLGVVGPILFRRHIGYYKADEGRKEKYEAEMKTLYMINRISKIGVGGTNWLIPSIAQQGGILGEKESFDDRLILYRGMEDTANDDLYPFASNNIYNFDKNISQIGGSDVNYSLMWDRDAGLYNQWWKDWYGIFEKRRILGYKLNLTIKDIKSFSFKDRVVIKNMEYYVKKMKISISMKGLEQTEAELIAIL